MSAWWKRAAHWPQPMYLRGLLKFHRHLGIPYMPRKPITHLQTGTHFDLDSGKHFPRSPPSAQTPWQFGERFILRQLTFHAKVSSVYFGCCTAELLFHQTTRGGGGETINWFVFCCLFVCLLTFGAEQIGLTMMEMTLKSAAS